MDAAPFAALRYDAAVAGSPTAASAPAYDLIEPMSYTQRRTASPYTVLELLAPDGAYRRSAQLFDRWRRAGVLVPEGPAFFRYEEHELAKGPEGPIFNVQRGILAALRLEPLDGGVVLPHEEVDDDRVAARLRRLEAVPAELDPVYLVIDDPPAELSALLTEEPKAPPIVAASDEHGTDHRIWELSDETRVARIRGLLEGTRALIADGHHRYARSLAFRDRCRARAGVAQARGSGDQEQPWERVFAYLVDPRAGGPRVEAQHRLLSPVSEEQLRKLEEDFVTEEAPSDPAALLARLTDAPGRAYGLLWPGGRGSVLRPRDDAALRARLPAQRSDAWRDLDAAVLLHGVLPRLGLAADSVEARADPWAGAEEVARGPRKALVLLRPPAISTVLELARRGERLPYKSTRFVPKPRTGLLLRPLRPVPPA